MIDLTFGNVSKRYLVHRESEADTGLHPWIRKLKALRARKEAFWALQDVSFEVERGETLGIIGHNGAGKSTILKLLAGITTPTAGRIVINGRLSALIEVGSGFHPELTGRENIFLNGAILGMSRGEITEKLDRIVEFAGVRPFLDVPVKRFSSGMYVRLGFSIAAHLDPDILLLDEVLAVGDAAFQEKCLQRISELRKAGTSIVFISHDLSAVQRICDRVVVMSRGAVATIGDPSKAISEYRNHTITSEHQSRSPLLPHTPAHVATSLCFWAETRGGGQLFFTGSRLVVEVEYRLGEDIPDAVVDVLLYSPDGAEECQLSTESSEAPLTLLAGSGTISFTCEELGILPGLYYADIGIRIRGALDVVHWHRQAGMLRIDPGKVTRGKFYQPHRWGLDAACVVLHKAVSPPSAGRRPFAPDEHRPVAGQLARER